MQHSASNWTSVAWIDLSDNEIEGVFRWADGVLASDGWTGWRIGEPNNADNEDCVFAVRSNTYTWNDVGCHRLFQAICERQGF